MKRFRFILCLLFAGILCFSMVGCGDTTGTDTPVVPPVTPATQYYDDISVAEGWSERGATLNIHGGVAEITNESTTQTYSSVTKRITINTKDYPYLEFGVARIDSGGRWALNFNVGDGEFTVFSERASLGIFSVDMRQWPELCDVENGTLTLCFYACGDYPGHRISYDIDFIKTESYSPFSEDFEDLSAWTLEGITGECEDGVAFLKGKGTMETKFPADFRHWTSFDIKPYQMSGSYRADLIASDGTVYALCGDRTGEAAEKLTVPLTEQGTFRLRITIDGDVSFESIECSATTLFSDDFSDEERSMSLWAEVTARIDVMEEGGETFARLTEGNSKSESGYIETPVYINATMFKYVKITVLRLDAGTTWALKCLYNGTEFSVFNGSGRPGTYYADLGVAGISGNAKFDLRLYVIGNEKTVDFGEVQVQSTRG